MNVLHLRRLTGLIAFLTAAVSLLTLPSILRAQSLDIALRKISARGDSGHVAFLPVPSDVLTPNVRLNSPNIKIALRAGFNRTAYSNDRYLDNTLLDVGQVSGESDVYGSAAGFGYSLGADVEYPFTTIFSLVASGTYEHTQFGGNGPVTEVCQNAAGELSLGNSVHTFDASIDYAKLAASMKMSLTKFYFMIGLSIGHPLSSTLTRRRTFGSNECFFPGTNVSTIEEKGEVPSVTGLLYAFRLGAGMIYHVGEKLQFSPELTLDFGSNAINKSPNSDIGVYTLSAVLRYDI